MKSYKKSYIKLNTMNEFFQRLKLDSPSFFKKLGNIGLALTAFGAGLIGAVQLDVPGFQFPDFVTKILQYITVAGAVLKFVASLTVQDPTQIKK